jgi:hypothetical protein
MGPTNTQCSVWDGMRYTVNADYNQNGVITSWSWKCNGISGGKDASCVQYNLGGACDPGKIGPQLVKPAAGTNCSSGIDTVITGTGAFNDPWKWNCDTTACSATLACGVPYTPEPIDHVCATGETGWQNGVFACKNNCGYFVDNANCNFTGLTPPVKDCGSPSTSGVKGGKWQEVAP